VRELRFPKRKVVWRLPVADVIDVAAVLRDSELFRFLRELGGFKQERNRPCARSRGGGSSQFSRLLRARLFEIEIDKRGTA
jgi:hypothetical protein